MKIAVVIPKYGLVGGAEGFACALTKRLALEPGLEVHVFANQWQNETAEITFHKVPILVFPRLMRQISFAWFASHQIKKGHFDLIHSHDRIFKMDLFSMHGIPHKTWIHRMRHKRLSLFDRCMAWVEKKGLTCRTQPTVLPVSNLVKNELLNSYPLDGNRIRVMHPGVSMEGFIRLNREKCRREIRQQHGLGPKETVLLFVGMNFEIKRLDLIIQAMSYFCKTYEKQNPPKLLVVGKGRSAPYLRMARDLGVAGQVVFAGVTRQIEKYYLAADIFAMPSVYDTFGMAVLEAMAAGLPVIISQTVGAKDLVQNGMNGFVLKDPPNAEDVAKKIRILSSPQKRLEMGNLAQERAAGHTWDHLAKQMLQIYRDTHRMRV
jgi:UDP-glucose:(heptosyl)LPS alpha-1,3-glucosyltransferase